MPPSSLERMSGLVAFDGQRADVIGLSARYRDSDLGVSGRVELQKKRDAIEMLLGAHTSTVALPYLNTMLPEMRLDGIALATADDPKAIALRGILSGAGPGEALDALFNVDSRGYGSIGPLHLSRNEGSLYARIALDRPHGLAIGLARVRNLTIPGVKATLNATLFGGQANAAIGINGVARVESALGTASAQTRVVSKGGALEGGLFGRLGDEAGFGASVAGTLHSPRIAGTVVVAGGRYRSFEVNGNAGFAFAGGTLRVSDAAVALGPLFIGASGTVRNLLNQGTFAPRYDLATELHSSDVSALLAAVQPRAAPFFQGSVDASLAVHGTGMRPAFAGTLSAPEGAVNGLSFRDFYGGVRGDTSALSLTAGARDRRFHERRIERPRDDAPRRERRRPGAASRPRRFQRSLRPRRYLCGNRASRRSPQRRAECKSSRAMAMRLLRARAFGRSRLATSRRTGGAAAARSRRR